jgi:acetolactate synthase-1/2/3 large subunit
LLERLRKRRGSADTSRNEALARWAKRHEERLRGWRGEALACSNRSPLDTRWVLHELNRVLPDDAIVVDETITHRLAVSCHLDRLKPGRFFSGAIGGLGTGLGTALGVKSAAPERPVILIIGDGSFNYNPVQAALGFAQEYRMPIMAVILNNHGYLSQKRGIPLFYPEGWAVRTSTFVGTSIAPSPDYAAIARAFDGHGEKVENPSEVSPALKRALQALAGGKLALVDMWLEPVS